MQEKCRKIIRITNVFIGNNGGYETKKEREKT